MIRRGPLFLRTILVSLLLLIILYNIAKSNTFTAFHPKVSEELDLLDPYRTMQGTGTLGRFADDLTSKGYRVNCFSVDSGVQLLEGKTPTTVKKSLDSKNGIQRFNPSDIEFGDFIGQQAELLNGKVEGYNNVFSDVWSDALVGPHLRIRIHTPIIYFSAILFVR